jgi:hypothetical protein
MFNNFFLFENRVVYEIMWKNIVEPDIPQITIWRLHITYRMPKATDTHSEYVILIAFSTATMVEQTRLNITSYVYFLSCYFCFYDTIDLDVISMTSSQDIFVFPNRLQ